MYLLHITVIHSNVLQNIVTEDGVNLEWFVLQFTFVEVVLLMDSGFFLLNWNGIKYTHCLSLRVSHVLSFQVVTSVIVIIIYDTMLN